MRNSKKSTLDNLGKSLFTISYPAKILILLAFFPSLAFADDFKTTDGKDYKNAQVTRVEPDGIVVKTKSGVSKIYFTELPKEVQEHFHYDQQQAIQYAAQTLKEDRVTQQQQAEEAQKRVEQKAAELKLRRQQQQAEMQRQQGQAKQQPQTQTAAKPTPYSRSQEGMPEHTYELLRDYTIGFGGVSIRLRQGEQYHGRILVDHAEIDRGGRSYTVPSGILLQKD